MKRLIRTLRYLKWTQILYQFKYKVFGFRKVKIRKKNIKVSGQFRILIPSLDCDRNYCQRFQPKKILNDKITLLHEQYEFHFGEWIQMKANHLWNFNLHYFEYGVAMAATYKAAKNKEYYDKFKAMYQDWYECNPIGKGDAWHPYTISMRITNLFIIEELFTEELQVDEDFWNLLQKSIYQQYRYLLKNQEKHILGNHYFENIKTVYLCALYFEEKKVAKKYENILISEINEQVTEDGMHYELSMMYHQIILEDLLRIRRALESLDKSNTTVWIVINKTIRKMTECMVSLHKGQNRMPFFNDAGEGVAKSHLILEKSVLLGQPWELFMRNFFQNAGYYKMYGGEIALLVDAGKVGPDYIPGHGHCDALSFELFYKKVPLFVNSGTYQYQGELRPYFRSTKAHNTVMINQHEQSECWGEHRVARRIRDAQGVLTKDGQKFHGEYKNYLGEKHIREIKLLDSQNIYIEDFVEAIVVEQVNSYLHIHPDYMCVKKTDNVVDVYKNEIQIATISFTKMQELKIYEKCCYSEEFGVLKECTTLEAVWSPKERKSSFTIKFKV